MLVKMRAQRKLLSPLGRVLHVMARSQLVRLLVIISRLYTNTTRSSTALFLPLRHLLVLGGGCNWALKTDYPARSQD
jgi:hypothetical protein